MKCPYCGEEMKKGFIQSQRGIIWSQYKKGLFFNPSKSKGDVAVTYFGLTGTSTDAYLCNSCKKIVINI